MANGFCIGQHSPKIQMLEIMESSENMAGKRKHELSPIVTCYK